MDITRIDGYLRHAGYWLIVGLALLVPIADRVPNILALLLAIAITLRAAIDWQKNFYPWDAIDWVMVGCMLSAIISTAVGWSPRNLHGIAEGVAYLATFFCLRYGNYNELQLRRIGIAIISGVALAASLALVTKVGKGMPFTFGGMAGTIHASMYTGIALILCIGFFFDAVGIKRMLVLVTALFLTITLLMLSSRAVITALIFSILVGMLGHFCCRKSFRLHFMIYAAILAMILAFVAIQFMPGPTKNRFEYKMNEMAEMFHGKISDNDRSRMEFWKVDVAWMKRGQNVLLGIGPRNFHLIDAEKLQLSEPLQFPEVTRNPAHAHNMYVTRYVEQGIIGLLILLALFVLVADKLLHDAKGSKTNWSWWGALGGLLLPCINGIVGSPWYRDYAWLAVLTFALYLASRNLDPDNLVSQAKEHRRTSASP